MNIFKKCAVKALSLAVALITALSVGVSASAAVKTPEIMSNDWSFLVVFFKSVDVTAELNGKTVNLKKTIANEQIDKIKQNIIDRMPYQFMQDTHGKVGIDVIDYAYVDEPLKNKDIELGICPADYYTTGEGKGYRAKVEGSKLVSGVLDECLEQNFYSQIMIFTPLGEISPYVSGRGGTKYSGVHVAQIIMFDADFPYYETILHEISHGPETDSNALNNNQTAPLHDMYWGNNAAIPQYDWYEYYMNDIRPDRKKGVEPMAFYRLRAEKYVIYYREKGSGKYKTLATVSGSKTSYSTSKLDKSKTYQFKIRSYAESDGKKYYSSYSKAVTAK